MQLFRFTIINCFLTATSLLAGNYVIDKAQSELAATMHATPPHNFTSVAKNFTCDIDIDPETLAITKAICSFNFEDLDSGKDARDKKMCKWMDIEKHPTATFEMKQLLPQNEAGEQVALGDFTMHAITQPVKVAFTLKREDDTIIIEGHSEMNHEDWGLNRVRLLFFSVDPLLKPHFRLVGKLNSDA